MPHHSPQLTVRAAYLLQAYRKGIFPMADGRHGDISWYLPHKRGILPLDQFHVPRRLKKTLRQAKFKVTFNHAFARVIQACSAPRRDQPDTWISAEIIDAYCELHHLGLAHSVETWRNDRLVGGLYGVAINGLFAGESMFSIVRDASKVALVTLVNHLRHRGFTLLDTQMYSEHLAQFGGIEIDNAEYQRLLAAALKVNAVF